MKGFRTKNRGLMVSVCAALITLPLVVSSGESIGLIESVRVFEESSEHLELFASQRDHFDGALLSAQSDYDPAATAAVAADAHRASGQSIDSLGYSLGGSKRTLWGGDVSASIGMSHHMVGADQNKVMRHTPRGTLAVSIPLLKSLRFEVNSAQIAAAQEELKAADLDFGSRKSQQLTLIVSAYWQYVALNEKAALLEVTARQTRKFVDDTKQLVEANERPEADLTLFLARLSDIEVVLADLKQRNYEQFVALVDLIGSDGRSLGWNPPTPVDSLPERFVSEASVDKAYRTMLSKALANNKELRGLKRKQSAARQRMIYARNNARHDLDLRLSGEAARTRYGAQHASEMRALVSLTYQFPWDNKLKKGECAQARSSYETAKSLHSLHRAQLENKIRLRLKSIALIAEKIAKRKHSLKYYQKSVEDEKTRFRMGMSTVFNVLMTERRYLDARLLSVNERLQYAIALCVLRNETGQLSQSDTLDDRELFRILTTLD